MHFKLHSNNLAYLALFFCLSLNLVGAQLTFKRAGLKDYESFCTSYPLHRWCMGVFAGGGRKRSPEFRSNPAFYEGLESDELAGDFDDNFKPAEVRHYNLNKARAINEHMRLLNLLEKLSAKNRDDTTK